MDRYSERIQELFYKALDKVASESELNELRHHMKMDLELSQMFDEFSSMRKDLSNLEIPYSLQFENGVMNAIEHKLKVVYRKSENIFSKYFYRIAVACIVVLAISFFNIYQTGGNFDQNALIGVQDISPEEAYVLAEME